MDLPDDPATDPPALEQAAEPSTATIPYRPAGRGLYRVGVGLTATGLGLFGVGSVMQATSDSDSWSPPGLQLQAMGAILSLPGPPMMNGGALWHAGDVGATPVPGIVGLASWGAGLTTARAMIDDEAAVPIYATGFGTSVVCAILQQHLARREGATIAIAPISTRERVGATLVVAF